jgi:septum site-determining protein MinD
MQRIIGVLSGKGGVGKTVTAINLSAAMSGFGHPTTVVDADISSANLTVHLGLPDATLSLQDVLEKKEQLYKTIRQLPKGLRIVPSSLSLEKSIVDMSGFKDIIRSELGGTVMIDSPPGFSKEVYHIIDACDDVLVVANPDIPSITDAIKMVEISKRMGKNNLGLILTRVEKNSSEIGTTEIEALCESPILGVIPEDRIVKASIFNRTPLIFHKPNSKAAIEYKKLAAGIIGHEYEPPSMVGLRRIFGL